MAIAQCLYLDVGFSHAKRLLSTIIFFLQSHNKGQKNDGLEVWGKTPAQMHEVMHI